MRENAASKGRRYLVEGRLIVTAINAMGIAANCRGAGEVHQLGYRRGRWWCSCPAKGVCSHLTALRLVVAVKGQGS